MKRRNNRLLTQSESRSELLANPGVEFDIDSSGVPDSWNVSPSGAQWSNSEAHSGSRSLRLTVSGATAEWIAYPFAVTGSASYRLRAYVKGSGSTQTFLTVRWWSDAGATAFISEDNRMLNSTYADWKLIEQTFTAPSNAVTADVMFRCPAATTADIYADDFSVRQVN